MKTFMIKVNGIAYEVEVEETSGLTSTAAAVPAAPAAAAAVAAVPAAAAPAAAVPAAAAAHSTAVPAGAHLIKAPMPGTILSVSVSVGDTVKKGQVLCILEAMKMENEIVAPQDGVVAGIHTSKSSSVNAGSPLVSLK